MHDLLFANQRDLTDTDLVRYATRLGLDEAHFNHVRASDVVESKIEAHVHRSLLVWFRPKRVA